MEHTFPQHDPAPAPAGQFDFDPGLDVTRDPAADADRDAFERWRREQMRQPMIEAEQRIIDAVRPTEPPAQTEAVEGEFVSRVELPSGGWAELADPRKIRAKHRKRVMDQLNIERMQSGKGGIAFDMTDGLILMMVEKWEVPYLPGVARPLDDPTSVEELMIPDYDALTSALAPAEAMLFPKPATIDGARTPGSPTRPGGA